MKSLHIATSLEHGGAQTMLLRLASGLKEERVEVVVVSLKGLGSLSPAFANAGITVHDAQLNGPAALPIAFLRLIRIIRLENPDVVHTWMYHSNLIGGLAARLSALGKPVCWSIHHFRLVPQSSKLLTRLVSRVSSWVSHILPTVILYLGPASRVSHEEQGYCSAKGRVIPNGVDTSLFRPSPLARELLRNQLGIERQDLVVGLVARYHPDKDVPTFVKAAEILSHRLPAVRFVLCGTGMEPNNSDLMQLLKRGGMQRRVHLLGERGDVATIIPGCDILTLSSVTESFPTVILEAMACGVPCVATDVGEVAEMIGETGVAVPPRSPDHLAAGWFSLLKLPSEERELLGQHATARVKERFALERCVKRHLDLYRSLLAGE